MRIRYVMAHHLRGESCFRIGFQRTIDIALRICDDKRVVMDRIIPCATVYMEADEKRKRFIDSLTSLLLALPWSEVFVAVWDWCKRWFHECGTSSLYKVLEYESTLELHDARGKKATFNKREKVRYLQNNIIAYQDQAWGDGRILVDYQCTPGRPVDIYRLGHKWHVLISRREVKSKDEEDTYHTTWKINDGFLKPTGYWETHITHPTQRAEINVILPASRHPKHLCFLENNRRRSRQVPVDNRSTLPDGRHRIHWRIDHPRLYENYVIQWEW